MGIVIRMLDRDDADVLERVDPDVFDGPLDGSLIQEFLHDSRHHMAVAIDGTYTVVGMASAFHHVHPDKAPQFFINEVGVAARYQKQGIGLRLLNELLACGARLGCVEGWVATEEHHAAARALFEKAGGNQAPETIVMYTFSLPADGAEPSDSQEDDT